MTNTNANPFLQPDFSKFAELTKMLGDYKIPSAPNMPNMEALIAVQKRNIEAFASISQAAYENMQSLARRQAEVLREGMQEAANLVNTVISAPSPEDKVIRQAEASKAAVDKCLATARDITDTLNKCNQQAMETVSTRLNEGIEELRGIIKQSADSSRAA